MQTDQQMRDIKEAAGEKWHYIVDKGTGLIFGNGYIPPTCSCGKKIANGIMHTNPSPTDTQELLRLAGKLGFVCIRFREWKNSTYTVVIDNLEYSKDFSARTQADALRNAIWQAIQGVGICRQPRT